MTRYRCLVLDHDDTTVDSTRQVNYPQFRQFVPTIRPGVHLTEDEYIIYCSDLGFYGMCDKILHYSREDLDAHLQNWKSYLTSHRAPFFPGMPEIIARQKAEGGVVCVVSHSPEDAIRPVYDHFGVAQPELVFGAELPEDRRKPNPWPLETIMARYSLSPEDVLVVDDAPLGGQMARSCGAAFACAAWYGMPEVLREKMRPQCDFFLEHVSDLERLLFN